MISSPSQTRFCKCAPDRLIDPAAQICKGNGGLGGAPAGASSLSCILAAAPAFTRPVYENVSAEVSLSGLSASSFDLPSRGAFIHAVASALGSPVAAVAIMGVAASGASGAGSKERRRLLQGGQVSGVRVAFTVATYTAAESEAAEGALGLTGGGVGAAGFLAALNAKLAAAGIGAQASSCASIDVGTQKKP